MRKVGRNEPCPCGSGKKYKKCCLDQPRASFASRLWSPEEVEEMATEVIVERLASMGISFNSDDFLRSVQESFSAEQISERWFDRFNVTAEGRDEDFPWFAAWVLWKRLAPEGNLSAEQIDELISEGENYAENGDMARCCDSYLEVWEAFKYKRRERDRSLAFLDEQYRGTFFIHNVLQDLMMHLDNAGLHEPLYLQKKLDFCKEFIAIFPDEDKEMTFGMRRDLGACYASLGNYVQAEAEFEQVVQDDPLNPWGYIHWGDIYRYGAVTDAKSARELYLKARDIASEKRDLYVVEERLKDLDRLRLP